MLWEDVQTIMKCLARPNGYVAWKQASASNGAALKVEGSIVDTIV